MAGGCLAPLVALLIVASIPVIRAAGANPHVMAASACRTCARCSGGCCRCCVFTAFRRYLQAVDIVKPITFALVSANVVNFAGQLDADVRALGRAGHGSGGLRLVHLDRRACTWRPSCSARSCGTSAGRATCCSASPGGRIWRVCGALVALGLPAAGQIAFEGAVFGIVTVMAARLDEVSLAAHGIAVQVIATTYMVPLGISSAAAVRVGQAVGRKDPRGVAAAGWAALLISSLFMGAAGIALWIVPRWIVRRLHRRCGGDRGGRRAAADRGVLRALRRPADGRRPARCAAWAIRGRRCWRTSIGYWVVGLPVAYLLCFPLRLGRARASGSG